MYEKHFGLKSRPFRTRTDAAGVFVGPAQAKLMSSLKKAFAASDAIVTVTGPVGVGKSTVVNRALEEIGNQRIVARVGRMQLAADEVLELLLTEFNVSRQPNGTIQRFAAFKRLLHDWAEAGTRAFIIVEDADRVGSDALIEMEALTASDSGDGAGAGIVLMGQSTLAERIAHPDLARLQQRIRLRHVAAPFSAAETQGYLKHCIRNAGGEFDNVFDPAAVDMLFRCSEGIPRVINNLCESVLAAAAEANAPLVLPQLVQHIAHEEFGLQPGRRVAERRSSDSESTHNPPSAKAIEVVAANLPLQANVVSEPTTTKGDVKAAATETESKPAMDMKVGAGADIEEPEANAHKHETEAAADIKSGTTPEGFEPMPVSTFTTEPEMRPVHHATPTTPAKTPEKALEKASEVVAPIGSAKAAESPLKEVPPVVATMAAAKVATAPVDVMQPMLPIEDSQLDAIPELIQDTQPALAALAMDDDLPDLTDLVIPAPAVKPKPVSAASKPAAKAGDGKRVPTLENIPTLSGELRIEKKPAPAMPAPAIAESIVKSPPAAATIALTADADDTENSKVEETITEIPSWDRDPTLAELKPDLAALEAELARVVAGPAAKPETRAEPVAPAAKKTAPAASSFDLPEITLEKELQVREIEAQEQRRKTAQPDSPDPVADAPVKRKHGFDLDKIAAELGKARSLEDVDDKLAETLFGEEMANAAAEIAAMVAANEPESPLAGAALELLEQVAPVDRPTAKPTDEAAKKTNPAPPEVAAKNPVEKATTPVKAAVKATATPDFSVAPAIEITLQTGPDPEPPAVTPEPIEEQFGTSMTATLKALSAAQVQNMDESANDGDEKPSRKLFGLFRSGN